MGVTKRVFAVFVIVCLVEATLVTAYAGPVLDGTYYWESRVDEEPKKYVDVLVRTAADGAVFVLLEFVWNPGAHVEASGTASAREITSTTTEDGTIVHAVRFVFRDTFNNEGEGTLEISGSQCRLTINVSELVDTRAARQYEDCTLNRRAADNP